MKTIGGDKCVVNNNLAMKSLGIITNAVLSKM